MSSRKIPYQRSIKSIGNKERDIGLLSIKRRWTHLDAISGHAIAKGWHIETKPIDTELTVVCKESGLVSIILHS